MKIWLIRDLEPLPTDTGHRRLMRTGMLAQTLAARGHDVTWFTSTFDHYRKYQRPGGTQALRAGPNLTIQMIEAPGYRRHVGLARIVHNRHFATQLRRHIRAFGTRPDIIITSNPTTETAQTGVSLGREMNVPTILWVADLWPDFFIDYLPEWLRPAARPLIMPLDRQVAYAAANATSVVGISAAYLQWAVDKGGRSVNDRDRVFPLGYAARPQPTDEAAAAFRQRHGLGDRIVVSFVGSWGRTYDLDLLREAAAQLRARRDLVLVISGDAASRPGLRDAFAAMPNVVLAGWLNAGDIATLVAISAIGLLPYAAKAPQGLPNKVFEYMAYGAYQVSTLDGEVAALYVETAAGQVSAPERLAQSIVDALPVALDPIARAARLAQFDRRFSASVVYPALADHIENVASQYTPAS